MGERASGGTFALERRDPDAVSLNGARELTKLVNCHKLTSAVAILLLSMPAAVSGLGLGDIELLSALNEPLDARVTLRSVKPGDVDGLQVGLASSEEFERAGLDRPFVLSRLRFSVVQGPGSQAAIRIVTSDPVKEPFLNFLLSVNWPEGRVIREYTVLLDPPVYGAAIRASVREAVTTVDTLPLPEQAEPATTASSAAAGGAPTVAPIGPAPGPLGATYGPVQSSDTAWSLARRYRPDRSVSIQQMMLAMLRANPEAFSQNNVNTLRAGAVLRIPDLGEINAVSAAIALEEVKNHHALWEDYRQSIGAAPASAPAEGPAEAQTTTDAGTSASVAAEDTSSTDASRLELVSAGSATEGAGGLSPGSQAEKLQNELHAALEELDSRKRENEEIQDRLVETESLIEDLQRLIELKDDNIAALQAQLAEVQAARAALEAEAAQMTEPMASAEEPAAEATPEPPRAQVPLPPPAGESQSWFDKVRSLATDNSAVLGAGAGGVLLVALIGFLLARRRRADATEPLAATRGEESLPTVAEADEVLVEPAAGLVELPEEIVPAAEEAIEIDSALAEETAEAPAVSPPQEDDLLEGLNIYLAYEDYDNATKLVKGVIETHPDRPEYKLRLLEIFYAAKDAPEFETAARALQSAVGDDSPLMEKARAWWADLSPGRALFASPVDDATAFDETHVGLVDESEDIFDVTGAGAVDRSDTMEISLDDVEAEGEASGVDLDLGFEFEDDLDKSMEATEAAPEAPAARPGGEVVGAELGESTGDIDFDLGWESDAETEAQAGAEPGETTGGIDLDLGLDSEPEPVPAPRAEAAEIADGLDFDLGLDEEVPLEAPVEVGEATGELDFDLGLEEEGPAEPTPEPEVGEVTGEIDFDLGLEDEAPAEPIPEPEVGEVTGEIDFDLGLEDEAPAEPVSEPEVGEVTSELDFDLGLEDEAPAASTPEPEVGEVTGEIDFDLGLEDETPAESMPEPGVDETTGERDVDLAPGAKPRAEAGSADSDLDLTAQTHSAETEAGPGEPPLGRGDEDLAAVRTEEETVVDLSVESPQVQAGGSARAAVRGGGASALAFDEGEPTVADSTEIPGEASGATQDEVRLGSGRVWGGVEPESAEGQAMGLVADEDDTVPLAPDDAAVEMEVGQDRTEYLLREAAPASPTPADETEELDLTLDADAPAATGDLDFDLGAAGPVGDEETGTGVDDGHQDMDFAFGESDADLGTDFETVQLKGDELAQAGAISHEDSQSLGDSEDKLEVDQDFAGLFDDETSLGEGELGLDLELPDSALAAEEGDVADTAGLDFALDSDEEPDSGLDSDEQAEAFQRTQYMLRDVPGDLSSEDAGERGPSEGLDLDPASGEIDEMQTKLDLAQAYIDMGDSEGARGILSEVMAEGVEDQKAAAKELLSKID